MQTHRINELFKDNRIRKLGDIWSVWDTPATEEQEGETKNQPPAELIKVEISGRGDI